MYIDKNTSTPYGEGVETSYDHNYIKICKVYWKNVPVNGQLKKQIWKTEDYDKQGALTKAVLLEDGVEVAIVIKKVLYSGKLSFFSTLFYRLTSNNKTILQINI